MKCKNNGLVESRVPLYYDRSDLKIEHGINSKQQGTCDMADLLGPEYTQEYLNRGLMRKDERCC